MTKDQMISRLRDPFPESDIQWRAARSGDKDGKPWAQLLAYVDARAVQERLDEVFGVFGWETYYDSDEKGIICRIRANVDGNWITKSDGAPYTNFEEYKGGVSDAFKRACSAGLGIGRYLYNLDEKFVYGSYSGNNTQLKIKCASKWAYFDKPVLPKWALPNGSGVHLDKEPPQQHEAPDDEKQRFIDTLRENLKDCDQRLDAYCFKQGWTTNGESWTSIRLDKIKLLYNMAMAKAV